MQCNENLFTMYHFKVIRVSSCKIILKILINDVLGMREMWSQMSIQKKNSYYKRVIQIYKRPNRDVVIASSSSNIDSNTFLIYVYGIVFHNLALENNILSASITSTDNTNPLSVSIDSSSVQLERQTSTPLSFHSIPSSITEDQSIISPPESDPKTNIFTDIVNELIKGAKGLDKLSCSPTAFANSIHKFVRYSMDKRIETVKNLELQIEK